MGTGDLRGPATVLQADGRISEILAHIEVFPEKKDSGISPLFTLVSLFAARFHMRSQVSKTEKKKEKIADQLLYFMRKVCLV